MFIKLREILSEERIGYFFHKEIFFYSIKISNKYFLISPYGEHYELKNNLMHSVSYYEDIYLNDILGNTYLIESNQIKEWNNDWKLILHNSFNSNYFIGYTGRITNRTYLLFNIDNNNTISLKNLNYPTWISRNHLFQHIDNEIHYIDLHNLTSEWHKSLTLYPTYQDSPIIKKNIGIYNNNLWIFLSSGYLLAIDIGSGEEKVLIEGFPPIQNAFLDDKRGTIFHFFKGIYYQLKLNDFSIEKIDLRSQMKNEGFSSVLVDYDNNYMYYIDPSKGWIGAIERISLTIVWQYNFKEMHNTRPIELKVNNDNLYISDSSNTLHVFEKEEGFSKV